MKNIALVLQKLIVLLLTTAIISCDKDEDINNIPRNTDLTQFEVKLNDSNTLRAEVLVKFSKNTSYYIEYWKSADKNTIQKTKTYTSDGVQQKALVLLYPETKYSCRIGYGDEQFSEVIEFTTGKAPILIPNHTLYVDEVTEPINGYLLGYNRNTPGSVYLMDTKGTILWYEVVKEGVLVANFDPKTNQIYMLTEPISQTFAYSGKNVKVIDLFGNLLLSKDLSTLPEMTNREAHHECRPLPNGNILLVTYVDKQFDLSQQGGNQNETVRGDGFVILNMEGQIIYQWDCFNTLNPAQDSQVMKTKSDWLHANSINYDVEGNYYMTFNRISELWKIDSQSGQVVYRVGRNGTVSIPESGKANGMHCANPQAPNEVLILDNARDKSKGSRAIMYKVNTEANTAEVILDCEIPQEYSSPNRSNAQQVDATKLLFGSGASRIILFTDRSAKAKVLRAIATPQIFYRVEYIPVITF